MLLWNPVLPTSVQMCLPKSFVFYIQAKLASYQFSGWPVDHHASSSPSHSGILILLQPFPFPSFLPVVFIVMSVAIITLSKYS